MQLKAVDIITDAMSLIGAVAINEPIKAPELQVGLRTLNMMIDKWSTNRLLLRSTDTTTIPLSANKYAYTIGTPSSDVTSAKPLRIFSSFMRDRNGVDYNIDVMPQEAYDKLQDKSFVYGLPAAMYYDPGTTQDGQEGTIYIYPAPDSAGPYTLYLECDIYLSEISTGNDIITFDKAYYEALVYGLASRLWRRYHTKEPIPADIAAFASSAISSLENLNSVQARASMDIPGKVSTFNVYSGDYN